MFSLIPSTPRCRACGSPFGGVGGRIMKVMGRTPSRKNPHWCSSCFEHSPEGGFVGTVGGIIGLALISALFPILGSNWAAVSALATLVLLVPLIVWLTFPETARRTLEDIAPDQPTR